MNESGNPVVTKQSGGAACDVDTTSAATALGQEAYKHIRAREYDAARPILERALSLDPENAMLAHMKAHLCIDSGAFQEGAEYLRPFLRTHDPFEGVNVHTAWHLAYIELEIGRPAAALDWHRRVVAPTVSPQTFFGAVSLLWRCEVLGHGGDALRTDWETLRAAALDIEAASNLDEVARAMAFIASGDGQNLARLLERVGAGADTPVRGDVVRPLIHGLGAYWRGDFAGAVTHIEPIVPSMGRLSEFVDQTSVFLDTLIAARALAPAAPAVAPA
jgi:hypothetical protein